MTIRFLRPLLCLLALTVVSTLGGRALAQRADIVDTAVAAGSFKTLVAAVKAADLADALKGEGPFTVFAPTDEAFAKLPKGTVETLLKPENREQLKAVLMYHVVSGRVPAKAVVDLKFAETLNGQRVAISVAGGNVRIDKSNVVKTDIACSNGIVHVVDRVLLPAQDTIPAVAAGAKSFNTLLAAAKAAGLAGALSGKGPFTVFAPTDEAFAKLPKGTVETLLKPENKQKLVDILKYHVVPGRIYSDQALKAGQAKTLQGGRVRIAVRGGKAQVNKSGLVKLDIQAANGVIHVIDAVLMPQDPKTSAAEQRRHIEHAISRGVKLFNAGHHAACAKVYMTAMQELADGEQMPPLLMQSVHSTMTKAQHTHCSTQRSWTLRRGLDHVYYSMRELK